MKTWSHFTGGHLDMPRQACPSTVIWVMITAAVLMCASVLDLPAFAEEGKETVEHEAGFYYTVKKGDTLWDLSERFADSPWIWPELWKENDQIPNPHQIYPGERIRLYHKDWIDRVSKQIPAPMEKTPPLSVASETAKEAAEVKPVPMPEFSYKPIDAVGFVRKEPAQPLGTIFKGQRAKAFYSTGDTVYIRNEKDNGMAAGSAYTVYRTLDPIKDPKTKRSYGIQHLLAGTIRITGLEPRYAIGVVEKSYRAIYIDDKLIPFEPRSPNITLVPAVPGLQGVLIGSEDRNALIAEFMTGFIDKGRVDGVAVGQEYLLSYQDSDRVNALDKDPIVLTSVNFGTVLVLHTEENTSTVLVTGARNSIAPGTTFRSPGQ
ncbi:MAG: LysM domain-containing protein [Pseudomonadota bacterium]